MPAEYGHPDRKEPVTPGRFEHEPNRLVRRSETLETGTAPFCCSPHLFPLRPALVAGGRRWPSPRIVPVQPDKIDETSSSPTQPVVQSIGSADKAARGVFNRQIRVVLVGPKNVVIGNVPAALDGIAVDAAEQKIVPVELSVRMNALRRDMLHRQVGRQTPLAVAAIATQPAHQVTDRIAVLGIGTRRGAAVNRPPLDLSVFLARVSRTSGMHDVGHVACSNHDGCCRPWPSPHPARCGGVRCSGRSGRVLRADARATARSRA